METPDAVRYGDAMPEVHTRICMRHRTKLVERGSNDRLWCPTGQGGGGHYASQWRVVNTERQRAFADVYPLRDSHAISPATDAPLLQVISLGGGIRSMVMALLAKVGVIKPMPKCAIFADSGGAGPAAYARLEWLQQEAKLPFPLHIVQTAPANHRLAVQGRIKGLLRMRPTQRWPRVLRVALWMGIATDTPAAQVPVMHQPPRKAAMPHPTITGRWPLIELGMSRRDCERWLVKHGHRMAFHEP